MQAGGCKQISPIIQLESFREFSFCSPGMWFKIMHFILLSCRLNFLKPKAITQLYLVVNEIDNFDKYM